ncbi:vesicular glutamate transporter 3-like [Planococcus citri]|uniref:vesicular glutamate transporter 3-like n=1 Tax=Planococcus citri TaxID=170843 RepID=UPI0031FA0896
MELTADANISEVSKSFLQYQNGKIPNTFVAGKPPLIFSKRFVVVILMFLSYVNEMIIRNNMNIAVIEMTSNKSISEDNSNITMPAEFDWDPKLIGIIISTIPYGGFFSIIGGFMASKLGGSVTCSISMMICGILTMFHPLSVYHSLNALLICRFLTGIHICFYTVSAADVLSHWVPRPERSTLMAVAFNGVCVGQAIVNPICGFIAHEWGWPMVFYVTGAISSVLSLILFFVVKNHPLQDKHISRKELSYILSGLDHTSTKKINHPYKLILTSLPVWALYSAIFSSSWLVTVLLLCLPQFIKDMTQRNTKDVGLISSIPNFVSIFMSPIAGALLDYWKNNTKISTTRMHKIIIGFVFLSQMGLFVASTFISNMSVLITFFTIIGTLWPFTSLILQIILVSIAPNDTSIISGFLTFWFCFSTVVSRTAIGFMTVEHSREEWNETFILTSVVLLISTLVFAFYGSSEAQSWSVSSSEHENLDQNYEHYSEELIEKRLPKIYLGKVDVMK